MRVGQEEQNKTQLLIPAEWWYVWCVVHDTEGRQYTVSLLIFVTYFGESNAVGVVPFLARVTKSPIVYGVFCVEDVAGGRYFSKERTNTFYDFQVLEHKNSFSVSLGDWVLQSDGKGDVVSFRCVHRGYRIDLDLSPQKQPVCISEDGSGERDLDFTAEFFVLSRLCVSGTIARAGDVRAVTGVGWYERACRESVPHDIAFLEYEWLHALFDDGQEAMISQAQKKQWTFFPSAAGCFIEKNGSAKLVYGSDFRMVRRDQAGARFGRAPKEWRVKSDVFDLNFIAKPFYDHRAVGAYKFFGLRYWQGGITIWRQDGGRFVPCGIGFAGAGVCQPFFLKAIKFVSDMIYGMLRFSLRRYARDYAWRVIVRSTRAHVFMLTFFIAEETVGCELKQMLAEKLRDARMRRHIEYIAATSRKHRAIFERIMFSLGSVTAEYVPLTQGDVILKTRSMFGEDSYEFFLAAAILFKQEDVESLLSYARALGSIGFFDVRALLSDIVQDEKIYIKQARKELAILASFRERALLFKLAKRIQRPSRIASVSVVARRLFTITRHPFFLFVLWSAKLRLPLV
ncbi:MAG: hypothetical protein A3F85_02740 [Candidatus Ryanbacteria bacterium RIFCSPLOWO2_12_FULL_44_26]|nr:MAG: hypothetical protein A2718_01415 [Candidatus Ryanbacteria bacterium RIFCSPHIGHO2_01_FULL_44_130]OGZ55351.1 MAG: hypothetical protein A3F85_02740 [Candidatus Ryanbacteria bacterium RIFCSPLOWO2_12_FULL_44_26]